MCEPSFDPRRAPVPTPAGASRKIRPAPLIGWLALGPTAFGAIALGAVTAHAAQPADAEVKALLEVPVEGRGPRTLSLLSVEYPPGGSSKPHRHDADVLVYVLEGDLDMQVTGQPLVHLHPGDTFRERPSDVHEVSRNASTTAPAKFLVVMLKPSAHAASHRSGARPGPASSAPPSAAALTPAPHPPAATAIAPH